MKVRTRLGAVAALALPLALSACLNHSHASHTGQLTDRQIAAATYWARSSMRNSGDGTRTWSATADLHPGFVGHSNTGHECKSGTLLRILVIGSFEGTNGKTVVETSVLEADPQALHVCTAYVKTGNYRPPADATAVLPLPGVGAMYRHIGRGPHDVPPGTP